MESRLRTQQPTVRDALAVAARLVQDGVTAFVDGDAFRGRRVQQSARTVMAGLDDWHDDALATWPRDKDAFVKERALASQIEILARSAQQLGGLAESRWAPSARDQMRKHAVDLAAPLQALLAPLADPTLPPAPAGTLQTLRGQRQAFMTWATHLGQENPRLLSSYVLAVAAAQRLDEAAEAAIAAANLVALQVAA